MDAERRAELLKCIDAMERVSAAFYPNAVRTGNHAFIEFTGLMNEYIQMCRTSLDAGIDFAMASKHTGQVLKVHGFQLNYLFEKLECIYGDTVAADMRQRLEQV